MPESQDINDILQEDAVSATDTGATADTSAIGNNEDTDTIFSTDMPFSDTSQSLLADETADVASGQPLLADETADVSSEQSLTDVSSGQPLDIQQFTETAEISVESLDALASALEEAKEQAIAREKCIYVRVSEETIGEFKQTYQELMGICQISAVDIENINEILFVVTAKGNVRFNASKIQVEDMNDRLAISTKCADVIRGCDIEKAGEPAADIQLGEFYLKPKGNITLVTDPINSRGGIIISVIEGKGELEIYDPQGIFIGTIPAPSEIEQTEGRESRGEIDTINLILNLIQQSGGTSVESNSSDIADDKPDRAEPEILGSENAGTICAQNNLCVHNALMRNPELLTVFVLIILATRSNVKVKKMLDQIKHGLLVCWEKCK